MVLRVKEGFSFDHQGVPVTLRVGQLVDEADPWVRGRETFFEPADKAAVHPPTSDAVETATAAPGERRVVTNPESRIVPPKDRNQGKQG